MADDRCVAAIHRRNRCFDSQSSGRARSRRMSDSEIVLASASSSRRTMLEAAGVTFTVVAPNVDEGLMKDMTGSRAHESRIADALAEAKALTVSERHPAALVIGAD